MNTSALEKVALSIRTLTIDAVEKAKSGHPGLPMGNAELGAVLFGELMNHNPANPKWPNRDRFILSAGHGSMFLYSLLHLSGYGLTIDDLKGFRQLRTLTPGHPEYGHTAGVETTTGPLGQGVGNAIGMAIAERMLAEKFNTPGHVIVDHFVYALSGDGCNMEGVTSEAASLAGHLKLGKVILFYDSNGITIDGTTRLAFTEDTGMRYEAYGWQVLKGNAHDFADIEKLVAQAKAEKNKPSIIILTSTIGKGSPNLAGTSKIHGAPLGEKEVAATKAALGVPETAMFFAAPEAYEYFKGRAAAYQKAEDDWNRIFAAWRAANPALAAEWDKFHGGYSIDEVAFADYKVGDKIATRSTGGDVLNATAKVIGNLVGGSADLAESNKTHLKDMGNFLPETPKGRNLNFGVREHGMGAIVNGMALHGGLRPFCATFFVFCDYMRPPIRLAAIMKLPVIYVFTHDSIFVGEDGPTHQPVEQLAALRLIPNVNLWRPGDAQEVVEAWKAMYRRIDGPGVIALTRQNLEVYGKPEDWKENIKKGAYIAKESKGAPKLVVIATGSEVEPCIKGAAAAGRDDVRVISMPCREVFQKQDVAYRDKLLPKGVKRLVVEAGVTAGWEGIMGDNGSIVSIDTFGECGPYQQLAVHYGIDAESLKKKIASL